MLPFGTSVASVWADCVRISAQVTAHVSLTTTASASLVSMARLNGPVLIALCVHALRTSLGLARLSMPMICILGQSALTKVSATAPLVLATVSQVMMVLLANVQSAQITAITVALAGLRRCLHLRRVVLIPILGML